MIELEDFIELCEKRSDLALRLLRKIRQQGFTFSIEPEFLKGQDRSKAIRAIYEELKAREIEGRAP